MILFFNITSDVVGISSFLIIPIGFLYVYGYFGLATSLTLLISISTLLLLLFKKKVTVEGQYIIIKNYLNVVFKRINKSDVAKVVIREKFLGYNDRIDVLIYLINETKEIHVKTYPIKEQAIQLINRLQLLNISTTLEKQK